MMMSSMTSYWRSVATSGLDGIKSVVGSDVKRQWDLRPRLNAWDWDEGKTKHLRPRRKCRPLDRAKTDVPGVRTDALRVRTCRVETETGTKRPKHWPQFWDQSGQDSRHWQLCVVLDHDADDDVHITDYGINTTLLHTSNGPLSRTTQVSRYQKGKTNLDFYWSKRQWVAVASAGPYASLHLASDR